jgi:hypothetical protein
MARKYATLLELATLKWRLTAVIASAAKQSTLFCAKGWIASAQGRLAMTTKG